MHIKKINLYLFSQIYKYFFLILFIFLSIAWLLQLTRLFTISSFIQIDILNIIYLSLYLIPNIITVITPFILIFGLMLCFIKLNNDKELIAILSLGLELKPIKNALIFFCFSIIIIFSLLNFYIAPKIYEQYKIQENDLRNTINFESMSFSNFLNLDNKTILDFNKINNEYRDIFISFKDEKENIVYANKGEILNNKNEYNFQLKNGFKISIDQNKVIEKLEFKNYILRIENTNQNDTKILDKNTLTIIDDINNKNYLNISFKVIDTLIILYIVFFFYNNNLKNINFEIKNNIYFLFSCIVVLISNQIFKNSEILLTNYILIVLAIILLSLVISYLKKIYE